MRPDLRAGVGAAVAGLAMAAWPAGAASAPSAACAASPARADEAAMTAMIAAERRSVRAHKVRRAARLLRAGRAKSMAMARGAPFDHSASMSWAGGRAAAQNIAMAPTAAQAFRAMLASPGHRANIRARKWRFAAVGAARSCGGAIFFTLNFMGPPVR